MLGAENQIVQASNVHANYCMRAKNIPPNKLKVFRSTAGYARDRAFRVHRRSEYNRFLYCLRRETIPKISRRRFGRCGVACSSRQLASHWRRYSSSGRLLRPGQRFKAPSDSIQFGVLSYSLRIISDAACPNGISPPVSISPRWSANHFAECGLSPCFSASLAYRRRMFLRYLIISSLNSLSLENGGSLFQVFANRFRPRSENASTIASSSQWLGGSGLACGCQLLANTWPNSWPN